MISRLLLLVAVLLMPFGMNAATAAVEHHAASMPMQHCPDRAPNHDSKGAFVECTMACSGALPAVDRSTEQPLVVEAEPAQPAAMRPLHGLHPETATPPPKFS